MEEGILNAGNGEGGEGASTTISTESTTGGDVKPWLEQVKPELRGHEAIKEVADVNDLTDRYIRTMGEVSTLRGSTEGLVRIPGENSTPEEKTAFMRSIGVPEKPEEYEIPVPDGQPTVVADWARGVFHKGNVPKETAKFLSEEWNKFQDEMGKEHQRVRENELKVGMDKLKDKWGGNFDGNINVVKRVAEKVGINDESAANWLTSHNAENDPFLINLLHTVAPFFLDDSSSNTPVPPTGRVDKNGVFKYPDM